MTPTEKILEQIREAQKLSEEATPGPWSVEETTNGAPYFTPFWFVVNGPDTPQTTLSRHVLEAQSGPEDADFVAAAREGWPRTLRQLEEAVKALEWISAEYSDMGAGSRADEALSRIASGE